MDKSEAKRVMAGLCLLALFVILLISLITCDPHDPPQADYPVNKTASNQCGIVGAYIAWALIRFIGVGSYVFVLSIGAFGVALVANRWLENWPVKLGGAALVLLSATCLAPGYGGMIGTLLGGQLVRLLGSGTIIVLSLLLVIGLMLATDGLPWILARIGVKRLITKYRERKAREAEAAAPEGDPQIMARSARPRKAEASKAEDEEEKEKEKEKFPEPKLVKKPIIEKSAAPLARRDDRRTLEPPLPRPVGRSVDYKLPPIDLLDLRETSDTQESEESVREKAAILERTLSEFGIEAQVVEIDRGPVITLYELELAAGIKIGRVSGLAGDIARALKAPSVRIVAPIPGKSTVGAEVPNQQREIVRLRELIESGLLEKKRLMIPLLLGKDSAGAPLVADLTQMPHVLIAGATGSGKSVCINSIIVSMLMTQYVEGCQMILIDPKMVELAPYQDIPHLMCPVLTDMKRAASVLEWATVKMDERYELLAQTGCRNITAYNKLGEQGIRERLHAEPDAMLDDIPIHMPFIVIVIDELADLMMTAAKEAEYAITRLAQKSRAVGIHIIMATQRPSVDVITGLIKANLSCRIAFQTSSMVDSRTILDRNGAETLLGAGDMLFIPPGTSRLVRAQGSFTSDKEIRAITDFWRAQGKPQYHADLIQKRPISDRPPQERDELYEDAVRIVLMTQRGSVSLLQRKLEIGYSRAARLIDMMAAQGVVGGYKGSQAREVLFTLDEWEAQRRAQAEASEEAASEEEGQEAE